MKFLAQEKLAQVAETDDHQQHLIIHQMAKKTWATWVHMAWHENLLAQQKKMQQMAAQLQASMGMGSEQGVGQAALGIAGGDRDQISNLLQWLQYKQPQPGVQKEILCSSSLLFSKKTANTRKSNNYQQIILSKLLRQYGS